jgi:phosphoesterase RecJ-like protein
VKSLAMPAGVPEFLRRYRRYLVIAHVEPDGDCLASALVLARYLRRSGRQAALFDEGPFDRPEIASFQPLFRAALRRQDLKEGTAAVVVDCSTVDRIGALGRAVAALPVLVIDHHAAGGRFGTQRWVHPGAPSVTFMIQHLLESLGERIPARDAELLLFGLCTDTGFFRHLEAGSEPVFQAVSRLVAAGASPQRVYGKIHAGWSLSRVRLLALALGRAERLAGGRLLLTFWTWADLEASRDPFSRGSDDVYRLLLTVEGVEVIVFLREEGPGRVSVGLRSSGRADVGRVAQALGGGGHAKAAGCTLPGTLEQARRRVLRELKARLGFRLSV